MQSQLSRRSLAIEGTLGHHQGNMPIEKNGASPLELARLLESFLAENPRAAILEDGRILFDMCHAHYSLSSEHGRCVLHLWSEERNIVRTVVGIDERKSSLRLTTTRLGAPRSEKLELVQDSERRTPTTRDNQRSRYVRLLERVTARVFPDYKAEGFRSAMDLEHSFGPAYARGMLLRGTSAWAVIGVNREENSATLDGILTLGILWLDYCREHGSERRLFEGLKVILPQGAERTTRLRMAWLNRGAAKWELYVLDERSEELIPVDVSDHGNDEAHLVHAFHPEAALERLQSPIQQLLQLLPQSGRERVEIHPRNASEVSFLLHGLEFARVRHGFSGNSFSREAQLSFGAGVNETPLHEGTRALFTDLVERLFSRRHPEGNALDPLFRLQPERWLESLLRSRLPDIEPSLRREFLYSQVPAFSAGDRGMLDLLTIDRNGRLMVVELKAEDDLHLPLQGLDYWIRVHWLNIPRKDGKGEFERFGYFPGTEISEQSPVLCLIAPVLHIHPANEIVLRYLSSRVEWQFVAISEHWRGELKVIFRKRN
jgi:hypothetical protein